jgi:hypothetical protein
MVMSSSVRMSPAEVLRAPLDEVDEEEVGVTSESEDGRPLGVLVGRR